MNAALRVRNERRPQAGRFAVTVGCALIVLSTAGELLAQASPARSPVRQIEVPASRPDLWPAGDWRPLSAEEYRKLIARLDERRPGPRRVWIERAEYTATLLGEALAEGFFTADVREQPGPAAFFELEPSNLAMRDLRWTGEDVAEANAVWGRAPGGETAVYVDRDSGMLEGRWTLAGEKLGPGVSFDIDVARANATSLRLRLPAGAILQSSCGVASGSETIDARGLREWTVDLGSRTHCRLTVLAVPAEAPARPVVLASSETSGAAREDGFHLQAKISLEVLNAPIKAVEVRAPDELNVYSVSYGDAPVAWTETQSSGGKKLRLELPDPLVGTSRSIRIQAIAPIRMGQEWEVPRLSVEGAFFSGGKVYVEVERPLELRGLRLHGSRQTATTARGARGESYTFEEFRPDAEILLRLGLPRLNLTADVVTHLSAVPEEWSFRSEVRWKCLAGSTFTAELAIPPEWDVTRVGAPDGDLLNWDVKGTPGGGLLVLDFAESLDSGETRAVEILARRRADPSAGRGTPLLLPQPQEARVSNMLLAVTHPARDFPEIRRGEAFTVLDGSQVPGEFIGGPVWRAFEAAQEENAAMLLHAVNPGPGAEISIAPRNRRFGGRAHVVVEFEGGQVREQVAAEVSPVEEPVTRLHVYSSAPGPEFAWQVSGDEAGIVSARRLSPDQHGRWGLPLTGELWEIIPASPLQRSFTIVGTRIRRVQPGDGVLLASLPEGANFEGTVELKAPQGRIPEFEARGAQRIDDAIAGTSPGTSSQRWRYRSASDVLEIVALPGDAARRTDRTARLQLTSRISATRGAELQHRARFRTGELRTPARFRFTLAESCSLITASLDGDPVTLTRQGSEYVTPTMSAARSHLVEIHYRSPSAEGLLRARQRVPVPTTPFDVLSFEWECELPDEIELAIAPDGVRLLSPPSGPSWTERLFGPLGRSSERGVFNPFSSEAWSELLFGQTPAKSDGPTSAVGRVVHRASAPMNPEVLVFETWNRLGGHMAAWAVFFATLLIGLVLRLYRVPGRVRIGSVWLASSFAAAWIAPAGWAEIAGAYIAGALLSLVVPRALVARRSRPDRDAVSIGSTETIPYGTAAAGSVLAAMVLLHATAGTAQEAASDAEDASPELAALIPVGEETEGTPAVVFVSKPLWELRQELERAAERPGWLISSAEYHVRITAQDSAQLRASYRIAVLDTSDSLRILLPITNAHLTGPDACRVNGAPHPVLAAADLSGFVIAPEAADVGERASAELTSPDAPVDAVRDGHWKPARDSRGETPIRFLDVDLDFRVPVIVDQTGGRLDVGIPGVSSARAVLSFARAEAAVEVVGALGRTTVGAMGRRIAVELGSTSRLQVVWSNDQEVNPSAETDASATALIDAQPTRLQIRFRVAYRVKRGSVHSLIWEVPNEMIPRALSLDGAEPITGWFLSPAGEATSHLHIPLAEWKDQDFLVEGSFTLPLQPEGDEIIVPAVDLLAAHPGREAMPYRHQIGIGTSALYRLEVDPADAGSLTTVSADAFLSEFARGANVAGIDKPRLAYRLQRPAELRLRLIPAKAERRVWLSQTAQIEPAEIVWTAAAEIETNAVPAFRHTLRVSPHLGIESITVHEDEVDRLERWSRDGDTVVLHLSDRTAGVQNVVLKGRMPLEPNRATALPLVGVADAEIVDSRLYLYRSPQADVELSGLSEFETLAGPLPSAPQRAATPALGQYRVPLDAAPPSVAARPPETRPVVDSLTTARPKADGTLEVGLLVRVRLPEGTRRPVRFAIPPELTDVRPIEAQHAVYRLEAGDGGSHVLVVTPEGPASGEATVALSATVLPEGTGEWVVPLLANDEHRGEDFLVLGADEKLTLVESSGSSPAVDVHPAWIARSETFRALGASARLFRGKGNDWHLRRHAAAATPGPEIALLDTELWHAASGQVFGTTRLVLPPADDLQSLRLNWPEDMRLRSLAVDGRQPRSVEPRSGVLVIPRAFAAVPQVVTIDWAAPVASERWPLQRTEIRLPMPQDALAEVVTGRVRAEHRPWIVREIGLRERSPFQEGLERLQAIVNACKGADPELLPRTQTYAELKELEQRLSGRRSDASRSEIERFDRVREEIGQLSAADPSGATASGPSLRTARSSGDFESALAGRLDGSGVLTWWAVDRSVLNWALLLIGMAVALPAATRLVHSRPSRWLQSHPSLAVALLGAAWWAWLQPSFFGLVLLLAAAVYAYQTRRREEPVTLDPVAAE